MVDNILCLNRYYSMYGHVEKLAEEIKKGASSVEGVDLSCGRFGFISFTFTIIEYNILCCQGINGAIVLQNP